MKIALLYLNLYFVFSLIRKNINTNLKMVKQIQSKKKMKIAMIVTTILAWCRYGHLPYTNGVVAVAGKQCLAIGRPGKWQTLWWIGLWCLRNDVGTKLFNSLLACQILWKSNKQVKNQIRNSAFFQRDKKNALNWLKSKSVWLDRCYITHWLVKIQRLKANKIDLASWLVVRTMR